MGILFSAQALAGLALVGIWILALAVCLNDYRTLTGKGYTC